MYATTLYCSLKLIYPSRYSVIQCESKKQKLNTQRMLVILKIEVFGHAVFCVSESTPLSLTAVKSLTCDHSLENGSYF